VEGKEEGKGGEKEVEFCSPNLKIVPAPMFTIAYTM